MHRDPEPVVLLVAGLRVRQQLTFAERQLEVKS